MKNRFMLAIAAFAGTCCAANGQIIISEVVSGPLAGGNPKFVEIFNASATRTITLGSETKFRAYFNGATSGFTIFDFGGNSGNNNVTLLPGTTFTVAGSSNGGQTVWNATYRANSPNFYYGSGLGNGNDSYTIEINGVISDIYGVVGPNADANGNPGTTGAAVPAVWGYSNGYAKRKVNVCAPRAVFLASEWTVSGVDALKAGATSDTGGVWTLNVQNNTTPNTHSSVCAAGNDCNGNGISDTTEIARNPALDCNRNGVLDSCEIASGSARDCNANGILDECEIAANPSRDCDRNGILDTCEIATNDCNNNGILDRCDIAAGTSADVNANGVPDSCEPFLFDCNGNLTEDTTDIANGTSHDCNHNNIPDECELNDGRLVDANLNGTADSCEGAYVGECDFNATVQPSPFGIRTGPNGLAFLNIEGANNNTFASYGGLRFNLAAMKTQFDTAYGAGQWSVTSAYLYLMQANAGFTAGGQVEIVWTNNDSQDFNDAANPEVTFYANYLTDYTDAAQVTQYTFTRGIDSPGHGGGDGTIESYKIADLSGNAGMNFVKGELNSGTGNLTLLLHELDPGVAATYAGKTNFSWRGPTLVVFAAASGNPCPACAADYNQDGGVDGGDIGAFFPDWEASSSCADINQDGGIDGGDVEAFFSVWENGGC